MVLYSFDQFPNGKNGRFKVDSAGDESLPAHAQHALFLRRLIHRILLCIFTILLRWRHIPIEITQRTLRVSLRLYRGTLHKVRNRLGYGQFPRRTFWLRYDLRRLHGHALRKHRRRCPYR